MKFGIGIPTSSEGWYAPAPFMDIEKLLRIVRLGEELGFDVGWANEHFIAPPGKLTSDERQSHLYEVLTFLSYAAAFTTRLQLAAGVVQLPMRDPILLAKQISTLDILSNGRAILGVGLGRMVEFAPLRPELADSRKRGAMLTECLEGTYKLLSEENASFSGDYYAFRDVSIHPKPVQHPFPIYIAGDSLTTLRRVAKWCKGWLMSLSSTSEPIPDRLNKLQVFLDKESRDISEVDVAAVTVLRISKTRRAAIEGFASTRSVVRAEGRDLEEFANSSFVGTVSEIVERIGTLSQQGVRHCMMRPTVNTFEEYIEQMQMFGEEVLPNFND